MSELKRYALSSAGRVFPDPDGNWVFHESARAALDSLKTQLATVREAHARTLAALERLADDIQCFDIKLEYDTDEADAEAMLERARAAIAAAKVTP